MTAQHLNDKKMHKTHIFFLKCFASLKKRYTFAPVKRNKRETMQKLK